MKKIVVETVKILFVICYRIMRLKKYKYKLSFFLLLLFSVAFCDQIIQFGDVGTARLNKIPYDYASFAVDEPELIKFEVYYQIYNYFLTFDKKDGNYFANYEFVVTVRDNKDNFLKDDKNIRQIKLDDLKRTTSLTEFRTNQATFILEQGKYKIQLLLRDKNTRKVYTDEFDVKLEKYHQKSPKFSDIEFAQAVGSVENQSSPFLKGDLNIIPSVSRIYGGFGEDNKLLFYVEIYPGEKISEEVVMITLLRHQVYGKMAYRDSVYITLEEPCTMQLRNISIDELRPGNYDLELELRNKKFKKLDKKTVSFNIKMTPEMFIKYDYENVLKQLDIIAEDDEVDKMKDIKDLKARVIAFKTFWEKRDPTPGSKYNETKAEFYRRIRYATNNFSYLRNNGWSSDRGRIYILYGEPDQLDDYPISPNRSPYQEWHYYKEGRYRKFLFVDEYEDGDYRLVYPYDGLNLRPDF